MCAYMLSQSVSDSLWPHGPQSARLLCLWGSPGKNTGVGCHFLLQGIFLTQGSNLSLLCLIHHRRPAKPSGVYQYSRLPDGKQVFSINHLICTTSSGTLRPAYQLRNSGSTPRSRSQMPAEGQPHSQPFPVCPVTAAVLSGHLTEVLSPSVKLLSCAFSPVVTLMHFVWRCFEIVNIPVSQSQ